MGANQQLGALVEASASAMFEAVRGVVDRPVETKTGALAAASLAVAVQGLTNPTVAVSGTLTQELAEKKIALWVPAESALTLVGMSQGKSDDDIRALRETGTLGDEELTAFGEVGRLLVAALDGVLGQEANPPSGVEAGDAALIDASTSIEDRAMVEVTLELEIQAHPTVSICLLIDREAADTWNGGEFAASAAGEPRPGLLPGDQPFEEIPLAEIRGKLAVYLHSQDVFDVVRRSCRRVGLEIDLHGQSEVPNPAAHKDQIVLMDVPPGEDRRYAWARRLKGYESNTSVVLVIQQPSKSRVLQGFLAKADTIVGWPLPEKVLSKKLGTVLEKLLEPAD